MLTVRLQVFFLFVLVVVAYFMYIVERWMMQRYITRNLTFWGMFSIKCMCWMESGQDNEEEIFLVEVSEIIMK